MIWRFKKMGFAKIANISKTVRPSGPQGTAGDRGNATDVQWGFERDHAVMTVRSIFISILQLIYSGDLNSLYG